MMTLIEYMSTQTGTSPWDKSSVMDISAKSLVTDVADLFYSDKLYHQLGSVYSILYSLGQVTSPPTKSSVSHMGYLVSP